MRAAAVAAGRAVSTCDALRWPLPESDPQRRHQPVIGFLAQAGAKDGAQIDVLTVGLAYLEELSPVYPTSQDELHRLAAVVGSPFTFLADR
jgi:hypothetical protein